MREMTKTDTAKAVRYPSRAWMLRLCCQDRSRGTFEDFDKRSGALMADGRRTLGDISRAANNFDRNPMRVIFGGGSSNNAQAAQPAPAPPAASGQKRQ